MDTPHCRLYRRYETMIVQRSTEIRVCVLTPLKPSIFSLVIHSLQPPFN